jgi:hypothetical protein
MMKKGPDGTIPHPLNRRWRWPTSSAIKPWRNSPDTLMFIPAKSHNGSVLLERAAGAFEAGESMEPPIDGKRLLAEIGEPTLGNGFLEGALT